MNFEKLATLIKERIIETINNSEWDEAIYPIQISTNNTVSAGMIILRSKGSEIARAILNGYSQFTDDIRESAKVNKWNKGDITVFRDGRFRTSFFLDESDKLQEEVRTAKSAVSGLYESLFERIAFEIKPEINWKTAVATVIVLNGKIDEQSHIILEDDPRIYPLNLDKFWQLKFPEFQEKTNSDPLKKYFPAWNTLKYYLRYGDNFNEDKDIDYQFINY